MKKITEIKIEGNFNEKNNYQYYLVSYYKNGEVKILGKLSVKQNCYTQIARYKK